MNPIEARAARLRSLLLAAPAPPAGDLAEAVLAVTTWFGAMQGQDARSLLWSLGVRLPGTTVTRLRAALEQRSVVRTWPMRGTLHLVPARDARWMVDLMAGRVARAAAARHRQLGLTADDVDRAVEVLAAALAGGGRLTRAQCLAALASAGIPVAGQAGYHLLAHASRRGVVCLAPEVDGEQTFVLLDEWAPGQRTPDPEEALATIALRYVRSHGPVTRRDLAGWTGLTLADVDRGVAGAGDQLCRVLVNGADMMAHAPAVDGGGTPEGSLLALPGFDEYVLGYKDRSLIMDPEHLQAVVPGGNGMFRSTLVRHGRVVGTWTRSISRGRLIVDAMPLVQLGAADRVGLEASLARFGAFAEATSVDVRWAPEG